MLTQRIDSIVQYWANNNILIAMQGVSATSEEIANRDRGWPFIKDGYCGRLMDRTSGLPRSLDSRKRRNEDFRTAPIPAASIATTAGYTSLHCTSP